MKEIVRATEIIRSRWPLILLAMFIGLSAVFILWVTTQDSYLLRWFADIRGGHKPQGYPPARFIIYEMFSIFAGLFGFALSVLLHIHVLTSRPTSKPLQFGIWLYLALFSTVFVAGFYLSDI